MIFSRSQAEGYLLGTTYAASAEKQETTKKFEEIYELFRGHKLNINLPPENRERTDLDITKGWLKGVAYSIAYPKEVYISGYQLDYRGIEVTKR